MITIICDDSVDKQALSSAIIDEVTKMALWGVGQYPMPDLFKKARKVIVDDNLCNIVITEDGLTFDVESSEDLGFSLAFGVFHRNNYDDEFGSCGESTMRFVAEQLMEQFDIESIEGDFLISGNVSQCMEHIYTENGEILEEIEDF